MIKAVTFDADQTLWDFAGVHRAALASTRDLMIDAGDVGAEDLTIADLQRIRDELAVAARGAPHDLAVLRRRSFEAALSRAGHARPSARSAELTEHYMSIRFGAIRMYDDVEAALAEIRARVPIGLLTNGNTDPERCGLRRVFNAVVMGPRHGVEKPDPRAFAIVAERLGVAPNELAHVGDDADDIDGANAVGAVSVLIERDGERPELRARADHRVESIAELVGLFGLDD